MSPLKDGLNEVNLDIDEGKEMTIASAVTDNKSLGVYVLYPRVTKNQSFPLPMPLIS